MVIPVGDVPNERGIPIANWVLIIANVAVFVLLTMPLAAERPPPGDPVLARYVDVLRHQLGPRAASEAASQASQYDLFVFTHAFRPAAPSVTGLMLSMFLHAGFAHLFGNMLFLWIYGDNVEHRLGAIRYVLAYLATGIAATVFHTLGDPTSELPMIGASGAISGILGLYFVWFPRNRVRLLVLVPPIFFRVFEIGSRRVLGGDLVLDNFLPYVIDPTGGGVAHGAHIGGFLAGAALALVARRRSVVVPPPDAKDIQAGAVPDETVVSPAIAAGRLEDAAGSYFALPADATRRILDPHEAVTLADWLRDHGRVQAALTALRRAVRDFPNAPGIALVHARLGEILLEDLDQPAMAYQHFMAAREQGPDPEAESIARRGLAEIEARQKRQIGVVHRRA